MIEIKGVNKTYPNGFNALTNINLQIESGSFFSLLGPSGCGKSTLLRIIAGLISQTSGQIIVNGQDISRIPPNERKINMVFQSYAVFPHMSVYNNIAYGLKIDKFSKAEIQAKVQEALELVKLTGYEKNMPDELSGGQRQRVAVARALVKKPMALLLDEPLSALDAKLRESMRSELVKIQKQAGVTFIFVTHDQSEALSLASQIAVMNKGKIAQTGSPFDIYEYPKSSFVADFIGSTNLLSATMQRENATTMVKIDGIEPFAYPIDEGWPEKFLIALRPEKVCLGKNTPPPPNISIKGHIEEIVYFGEKTHVKLKLVNGTSLFSYIAEYERKPLGNIKEGDELWCFWETADIHPIRE